VSPEEVRRVVAAAIARATHLGTDDVVAADSLFELPGFDSLAIVEILGLLERDLRIEIPAEVVLPETFGRLDSLTRVVLSALDRAQPGGGAAQAGLRRAESAATVLLHDLVDIAARESADHPALTHAGNTWSYRRIHEYSQRCARWLRDRGVERGDRVLLVLPNGADAVALVFAASRLGALYVVVSTATRPFHLRHILYDAEPRIVVASTAEVQEIRAMHPVAVVDVDEVRAQTQPPAQKQPGAQTSPQAQTPLQAQTSPQAQAPPRAGGHGATVISVDPVALTYTSGSTAMPKAVVSTHGQVLFAVAAIQSRLGYRDDDVIFCCLPLAFDYGLYQVFLSFSAGAHLVLGDDSDAGPGLLNRLVAERATVLPLVPSLAVTLVRLLARSPKRTAALRMVTNTGATLPASVADSLRARIPGLGVVLMFGLTECKRVSILEPNGDLDHPGSVGTPLPDTEVYVIDEQGHRMPPGRSGELVVRGPHVMAGYWRAPDLTRRTFPGDELGQALLRTGDQCHLDAAGYLYFDGRCDDIFKQRGFRVSTLEIEAAALDVEGVEIAAALPPADGRGARLAVVGAISAATLRAELRLRLEEHKWPDEYVVLDDLPISPNGKTDRLRLAARLAQGSLDQAPLVEAPLGAGPLGAEATR
jgi:acyl-CoA synthetase (AMP-forming)/AMP-acid ligase II/acyl carrier protein